MAKVSFLQHLYQQLRDAAMDWCKNEITDEHCVFNVDADRGDNFWVQLVRPANVKSAAFRESSGRFLKKLEEDGLINDLLPVKLTITQNGTALDIEGEARKIGQLDESVLLTKLAEELVKGFKYAEETSYEDQGAKPPYTLTIVGPTQGVVQIDMDVKEVRGQGVQSIGDPSRRLWAYAHEFFEEHLIKPKITFKRIVGRYTLTLTMAG